ncbi:MAG: hypothetical protein LBT51_01760 [Fusobacteriaceae bacterium]|nr:hypothetical protein [Fusobacteriaceae bacterium]
MIVKTNKRMEKLIEQAKKYKENKDIKMLGVSLKRLTRLFNPNLVLIYDCIIMSDENKEYLEANFEKSINQFSNKTKYEMWYSKTRIDNFIGYRTAKVAAIAVGLMVIEAWSLKLKSIANNSKFCIIMSYDSGWSSVVTLTYHKIRANEKQTWLTDDIDESKPIGYFVF